MAFWTKTNIHQHIKLNMHTMQKIKEVSTWLQIHMEEYKKSENASYAPWSA